MYVMHCWHQRNPVHPPLLDKASAHDALGTFPRGIAPTSMTGASQCAHGIPRDNSTLLPRVGLGTKHDNQMKSLELDGETKTGTGRNTEYSTSV